MQNFGIGTSGFGSGSNTPSLSNLDLNALQNQFPALVNLINQSTSQARAPKVSALDEHRAFLKELPNETRMSIEENEEYQQIKMLIFQEFLNWSIGNTELGREFALTVGERSLQALSDKARELEPTVINSRNKEVEALKEELTVKDSKISNLEDKLQSLSVKLENVVTTMASQRQIQTIPTSLENVKPIVEQIHKVETIDSSSNLIVSPDSTVHTTPQTIPITLN